MTKENKVFTSENDRANYFQGNPIRQTAVSNSTSQFKEPMTKVFITLKEWKQEGESIRDFDCGTKLIVNGVQCDKDYAGGSVVPALTFTLKRLGYEAVISFEEELKQE